MPFLRSVSSISSMEQGDRMEQKAERRRNGAVAAVPSADRDIERRLVWAYQVQCAHRCEQGIERELSLLGRVVGGYDGMPVDGTGAGAFDLAPEAEAIHAAVSRLAWPTISVVVRCARTASRPDWGEGLVPHVVPVMDRTAARERPLIRRFDGDACLVDYEDFPDQLHQMRANYTAWWSALRTLAVGLRAWSIIGPIAPPSPWSSVGP